MSFDIAAPFDDVDVSSFAIDRPEQLGAKPKQWLRDGDDRWLFKWLSDEPGRRHRGEDWAERVVGEIGVALGVQCAYVELAHRGEIRAIISRDVADDYDLVQAMSCWPETWPITRATNCDELPPTRSSTSSRFCAASSRLH